MEETPSHSSSLFSWGWDLRKWSHLKWSVVSIIVCYEIFLWSLTGVGLLWCAQMCKMMHQWIPSVYLFDLIFIKYLFLLLLLLLLLVVVMMMMMMMMMMIIIRDAPIAIFLADSDFFGSVTCRYRFLPIPIFFLWTIIDSIYKQNTTTLKIKCSVTGKRKK